MPCKTCGHTIHNLPAVTGQALFWCSRCGTLLAGRDETVHDEIPKLVKRCREFASILDVNQAIELSPQKLLQKWHELGIRESINVPEERNP